MTVDEGVDITTQRDRGVLKRIIREGTGHETPSAGCNVSVHYTGTFTNGTKFDSSRDRNEVFQFILGKETVIKAWEIGVASMKRGEVCVLTCAPSYGYGAAEYGKIPRNSTLQYEIELIDWENEDLSPDKDHSVTRCIITPGTSVDSISEGSLVTVELEGRIRDDEKVFDNRTVTFSLGEGSEHNICEGVEVALQQFSKGEKSNVYIKPKYGFKDGNTELGVPPNKELHYTLTLVNFENEKEAWTMDADERLEQASLLKEKGTNYFKQNKYPLALKMYNRVVDLIENLSKADAESDETKSKAKQLLLSTYLNLALVHNKMSQYFDSREQADKALNIDPNNVKGLFRRGQALVSLNDAALALDDFRRVLEIEPNNTAAARQVPVCRNIIQKQKQLEKKLYANMFDKFAKLDTEVRLFDKFAKLDTELEQIKARQEIDVMGQTVGEWGKGEGEWTDEQRDRKPTDFERENPNILILDKDGQFENM